ncbi:Transposase [Mimivirus argentum]|uniref:Uncharacterized protein n=1 Tax=Mimivirus sp. 'lentille' TaxID=1128146 RepID=H6WBD6_9VIRU|nr:hypothetical protein tv_L4 [Mimivirus lentille]AEY99256.1 hypothetical protein tv_L4 [Acanthamoeba castellanii mamavirus]UMZ08536.1 Transposase [Mimivirus argentum]
MSLKEQRDRNIYDKVNELYTTKFLTIEAACKKIGICKQTYYNIKKSIEKTNMNGGSSMKNNNINKETSPVKIVKTPTIINNNTENNAKIKRRMSKKEAFNFLDEKEQKLFNK